MAVRTLAVAVDGLQPIQPLEFHFAGSLIELESPVERCADVELLVIPKPVIHARQAVEEVIAIATTTKGQNHRGVSRVES